MPPYYKNNSNYGVIGWFDFESNGTEKPKLKHFFYHNHIATESPFTIKAPIDFEKEKLLFNP